MSQPSSVSAERGPTHRAVEIGVAAFTALFGAVVILGSAQAGLGWAAEGPRSGFFPFLIGSSILIASVVNLARALIMARARTFARWDQLRQVLMVVVPTAVYVVLVPTLGIYISSALLIGAFMRWFGRYGWTMVLAVALSTPVVVYATFERWFLVPLPKGPVEYWLGL